MNEHGLDGVRRVPLIDDDDDDKIQTIYLSRFGFLLFHVSNMTPLIAVIIVA